MENTKIKFESPKPFPMTMFDFKHYDGAKAFALFLFVLACVYFFAGMKNIFFWEDSWWKPNSALKMMYFFYQKTTFVFYEVI